jgi:short-subunit dehydrogenase
MATWKTALITGASSGIGRGLAEQLAARGTEVVLCARRQRELAEVASVITLAGGRAHVRPIDVADTSRTVELVRSVDDELGGLDLIIANAGVGAPEAGTSLTWEALAGPCHINFCGAVATLTAVLPRMKERGRGHVVGISSLAAFGPLPTGAAYCAPKAGLSMLLECLRLDLTGSGVHVTAVHPGFVRTQMVRSTSFEMPMLMEVDDAVALIVRELEHAPATIDFPRPLAMAARLGGLLPRPLRRLALRRDKFSR